VNKTNEYIKKVREIYDRLAIGWNTWNVRSVTSHVFLPEIRDTKDSIVVRDKNLEFVCKGLQKPIGNIWNPCKTPNLVYPASGDIYFIIKIKKR